MNFKKYHVSRNLLSEKYENRSINGSGAFTIDNTYDLWLCEVVAGQTYAISNMNYVYGFFATKPMPNTGATYDGSRGYEMSGTVIVTVPSGCTWIAVRVLHNADNAMLNEGSTPLPYEPYSSEVWHDTPHYIHNTSTDTITTLPAVVYPNGTTATVGLKGQATQSGTPTPDNPIMPQGTGEKTGNLLFKKIVNGGINPSGQVNETTAYDLFVAKVTAGDTVTASNFAEAYAFYGSEPATGSISIDNTRYITYDTPYTITIPNGAEYIAVRAYKTQDNTMLNLGSTPLPYEPYGIKIPILSAGQTTPIYLGEVQSTRQIKKLVLDGTENVVYNARNDNRGRFAVTVGIPITGTSVPYNVISSHLPTLNSVDVILLQTGICMRSTATDVVIAMAYGEVGITSPTDALTITTAVKSYLAQQYSAGTPVCVWYVLATEETAVVNEPLMRIGDYADTLSNIAIPVTAGGDTLSVGTTVQPSEVTVNYTGWHDATVKEWDGSQWNE